MSQSLSHNGIKEISKNKWWCLHIYNFKTFDDIIANYIRPVIEYLYKEKLIKKFFFIRYGDTKGAHVRLRLYLNAQTADNIVKPYVFAKLNDYFKQPKSLNDNYFEVAYEQEIDRYGGTEAISFAESIFELSSSCILQLYKKTKNIEYSNAISLSIQMNYLFGKLLFDGSSKELRSIYQFSCEAWLHHAVILSRQNNKQELLERFKISYAKQKNHIINMVNELDLVIENKTIKDPFYKKLKKGLITLNKKLQTLQFYEKDDSKEGSVFSSKTLNHKLLSVYDSYMHMNNNRLGVSNVDEAFIAYILANTIERVSDKNP